jgi:hypothetical protein
MRKRTTNLVKAWKPNSGGVLIEGVFRGVQLRIAAIDQGFRCIKVILRKAVKQCDAQTENLNRAY